VPRAKRHHPIAALTVLQVHVFHRLADSRDDAEVSEVTYVVADLNHDADKAIDLFDLFDLEVPVEVTAMSVTPATGLGGPDPIAL
jgi:hypothetical protein